MTPEEEAAEERAADRLSQSPYLLAQARSRQIFDSDIAPFLFAHGQSRQRPRAVILIAQPGAGKTAITRRLRGDFAEDGDAVSVEVDGLKPFHPRLTELQHGVGEVTADEYVQADARRWQEMAVEHLLARRVHVVLEQFPRSQDMLVDLLVQLTDAGYEVEAALLATPLALSKQGVLLRYQAGHEGGGGRDVPDDKQEERFHQLPQIADWLQDDPRVSRITLYRRDGNLVHDNARDDGAQWNRGSSRQALEAERLRQWSLAESTEFRDGQHRLTQSLSLEWRPRIEAAWIAARALLHPDVQTPSSPRPARAMPPPTEKGTGPALHRRRSFTDDPADSAPLSPDRDHRRGR